MSDNEIHSVIVPLTGMHLLIPNTTVAEVVGFTEPEPIPGAIDWVLGTMLWRGWQVPIISFAGLIDEGTSENKRGARVCIIKTLINTERMPYMAILAQDHPQLTAVTEDNLDEITTESNPIAVAGRVQVDGRDALIPDLDRLGHLVAHAAFGALPLTSSSG